MHVGVVMPTFNQVWWIEKALASYFQQHYSSKSLVIVNDGSTDGTRGTIASILPSLRAIHHDTNKGTAAAINTGVDALVAAEKLDALTWISSDNEMDPDWLWRLVEAAEVDHEGRMGVGVVYSGFWYCVPGRKDHYLFKPHTRDRLLEEINCFYGPSFIIRRDVWQEAGHHRGKISHDYDHWLRVEEVCYRRGLRIVGVDAPLCRYNAHDQRVTVTRADQFDAYHWQAEARKRRAAEVQGK